MSKVALLWARNAQATGPLPHAERAVLVTLADAASTDTVEVWLGPEQVAARSGVSLRHVKRCIPSLVRKGLLVRGDQGRAAELPANHRPTVYRLDMTARAVTHSSRQPVDIEPNRGDTVTPQVIHREGSRGDMVSSTGVTWCHSNQELNPKNKPPSVPPDAEPPKFSTGAPVDDHATSRDDATPPTAHPLAGTRCPEHPDGIRRLRDGRCLGCMADAIEAGRPLPDAPPRLVAVDHAPPPTCTPERTAPDARRRDAATA